MMLAALTALDWGIVAAYMVAMLLIGLWYTRRAGSSTHEYFLSGRNLPWWLAGTSIVATSFSADTPLVVTGWVRKDGIGGNWIWWCFLTGGMLSVFLLSRLWRRAEIVTDVELTELRYSGRSAAVLRGLKGLYMAIPINCLTLAWVLVAMVKVTTVIFDLQPLVVAMPGGTEMDLMPVLIIAACSLLTTGYCAMSGLWGVVVTDLVQFALAMGGCVILCIVVVAQLGGLEDVVTDSVATSALHDRLLAFFPSLPSAWEPWTLSFWEGPFVAFVMFTTVLCWANKNADGGGVVINRMAACKDERHALLATLWFNIANYAVRPWPWILVALASVVVFPDVQDGELAYPMMVERYSPLVPGLMGVMVATFLAAFMSTITTHIHLGATYVVNDFYRRFVHKDRSDRHYVWVSRWASLGVMVLSGVLALAMNSISDLFVFLLLFSSGTGLVFILRWFWWRINAWSEVSAMVASGAIAVVLQACYGSAAVKSLAPLMLLITVAGSTVVWVLVTLLTRPVEMERLVEFYRKVRPYGAWGPVAARAGVAPVYGLGRQAVNWLAATAMVFGLTFALGKFLLCEPLEGALWLVPSVAGAAVVWHEVRRLNAGASA
jgi:Na+/proline symporter